MNLFLNYLKEREGLDAIETEKGFILYKFFVARDGKENCFISDYYVAPDHRGQGIAYTLADKVFSLCEERGVKTVFCQSDITAKNHKVAAQSILNFGFEVCRLEGNIIHYFMEVSSWAK